MDIATADLLVSPIGAAALAEAAAVEPTVAKYPACFDRLRKRFPADLSRAALDVTLLRPKARAKFTRAGAMLFTREALEMASGDAVARYRAERFAGFPVVADLCCGIGGDAIGLGLAGRAVVAVDRDPVLVRMADANLAAYGLTARFVCGDVLSAELPPVDAAFADPGRRPGGRRTLSVRDCEPPVAALVGRFSAGFPLAVKLAPGVPKADLTGFDAAPEWVSLGGELKECIMWFGPLRTETNAGEVRATVLPGPHILMGVPTPDVEVGPVARYVYDPDPAVTRSGLVNVLAGLLGAHAIDVGIAFLTADELVRTPFATAYRVEEVLPFHAKRVGEWLRERSVGSVTFVKRGSDADADELKMKWKLGGDRHRQVLLTRSGGVHVAIVAERLADAGPPVGAD